MNPQPQLHAITEFGLSVFMVPMVPFKGYTEAEFSAPILSDCVLNIPLLVVSESITHTFLLQLEQTSPL